MCQVHTGVFVSLLAWKNRLYIYTACHPIIKTTIIDYIARSTYHYAYARQTQVNWKKEAKKKKENNNKGKARKDNSSTML